MDQEFNISEIINCLKCPTCNDLLTIPIYQCLNGHSTCKNCSRCGECNSVVSLRNLALERILMKIDTRCKFKGCNSVFPVSDLQKHEEECPFNPQLKCMIENCQWKGPDFLEHLKNNHEVKEFRMPKEGGIRGWNSKTWKNADWGFSIWKFDTEYILNRSFSNGETFFVYMYSLDTVKTVSLRTLNPDYGLEYVIYAHPIRIMEDHLDQLPFHVSLEEAEKFLLEPATGLEGGYKRLSLFVSINQS